MTLTDDEINRVLAEFEGWSPPTPGTCAFWVKPNADCRDKYHDRPPNYLHPKQGLVHLFGEGRVIDELINQNLIDCCEPRIRKNTYGTRYTCKVLRYHVGYDESITKFSDKSLVRATALAAVEVIQSAGMKKT